MTKRSVAEIAIPKDASDPPKDAPGILIAEYTYIYIYIYIEILPNVQYRAHIE